MTPPSSSFEKSRSSSTIKCSPPPPPPPPTPLPPLVSLSEEWVGNWEQWKNSGASIVEGKREKGKINLGEIIIYEKLREEKILVRERE